MKRAPNDHRQLVLALVVAIGASGACGGRGAPPQPGSRVTQRPPIVVVSIDTLRADHLPDYGYRGVATPAIDALRRDGILFTRAYTHAPLTLPAHVSLLSG